MSHALPGLHPDASRPVLADVTLEMLLALAAGGDEQAFASFYDQTSCRVYGLVLRVLRDPHQTEEVTQDVYLDIWLQAGRFDPNAGSALNWTLMRARSRAIDRVRSAEKSRHRDTTFFDGDHRIPYDSTVEQAEAADIARTVHAVLDLVTPVQRTALELFYVHGLSQQEVADRTGQPLGTTKSRLRDGLRHLQRLHDDNGLRVA